MKKTVKIGASLECVLPTGPYQNQRPGFYVEEVIEDCPMTDEEIKARQKEMYAHCEKLVKDAEETAIRERINLERKDFRWYTDPKSGLTLPSVTSIINFDADFFMEPNQLRQYASQGNLTHKQVSHYVKTGEWISAKDITDKYPDYWVDYVIVRKGELGLPVEGFDFPAFVEKYPIAFTDSDRRVVNPNDKYAGTLDLIGTPTANPKEEILGVLTLIDVKRTVDKYKNFMQTAAYAKAYELETGIKIEQMMIIPANPGKTKQGFSKPEVSCDVDKFYALFMEKRNKFRSRYGI